MADGKRKDFELNSSNITRTKSVLDLGFEVFTAVSMKMAVFWVVAPCSLVHYRPDDGGSKDL
jgi:hypothetical protein